MRIAFASISIIVAVTLAGCQGATSERVAGDAAPVAAKATFPPDETDTVFRTAGPYYVVVVAVATSPNDVRVRTAEGSLREVGYDVAVGGIDYHGCGDSVIYDQLKLDPNHLHYVVATTFSTSERAQQFASAYKYHTERQVAAVVKRESICDAGG